MIFFETEILISLYDYYSLNVWITQNHSNAAAEFQAQNMSATRPPKED